MAKSPTTGAAIRLAEALRSLRKLNDMANSPALSLASTGAEAKRLSHAPIHVHGLVGGDGEVATNHDLRKRVDSVLKGKEVCRLSAKVELKFGA